MIPKELKYVLLVLAYLALSFRSTAQCMDVTVVGNTAIVTSTANLGFGSLRAAIICVNDVGSGVNEINFNVPGGGDVTFAPNALLPLATITKDNVTIDARTQPGWTLGSVVIDGINSIANGFTVNADNVAIYGFFIKNFTNATNGSGIELVSGTGHLIQENALSGNRIGLLGNAANLSFTANNNAIGIDPTNATPLGNSSQGIFTLPSSSADYVITNNEIAYNNIGVETASPLVNALISQNDMYCNTLGGIERNGFTVSPLSITSATTGVVSGLGPSGATIELFINDDSGCAAPAPCQGSTFLGSTTITAASNDWSINIGGLALNTDEVTITATVGGNNTSEFISCSALTCSAITVSFTNITDACAGQSTGSATAVPMGGTGPYTYLWSDNQTTATAVNLTPGSYSVIVSDVAQCSDSGVVTIGTATAPTVAPSSNNPLCEGETISLMANPNDMGLAPLTFSWDGPNSFTSSTENPTIANAGLNAAGLYQVTVTGSNNCSSRMETDVVINELPSFTLTPVDVECNGTSEGRIELNIVGNPNDFAYNWSNGASTQNLGNIPAGNYSVTVTNQASMCFSEDNVAVGEPDALTLLFNHTAPSCGSNNGSATAIPGGGTPNYTYAWDNGQNGATATNLVAGTYEVTVTDMAGCTIIDQVTLSDIGGPSLAPTVMDVACNGETTGTINLNISGGIPPITISWNNGADTEIITNLSAGTYEATVTDGNGCQATTSIPLSESDALTATIDTSPSACNAPTGTASANAIGGTPGYTIQWDNGDSGTSTENLSAGNHSVSITDVLGCQIIENFAVGTVESPTVSILSITDVLCQGESTGNISIDVSGGLPPYDYSWNDGSNAPNLENVPAGNYSVTVNDQNGCIAILGGMIEEPFLPLLLTTSSTDAACGQADGTASVNVDGGTLPHTITWSNGETGSTIIGLTAGIYEVTVTDGNDCEAITSVAVSDENAPVLGTLIEDINCNGESSGTIILSIMGGAMPYDISWSNGASNETIENLEAGTYDVTVEDANQCQSTASATVFEPDALDIEITISSLDCSGINSAALANVNGGIPDYAYAWSNGSTTETADNLSPGVYTLTVTDDFNCMAAESVSIPENLGLDITNTSPISILGAEDGSVTFEIIDGTPPFQYTYSGPENGDGDLTSNSSETIENLLPGSYTLEISDANGCVVSSTFIISNAGCDLMIDSVQATTSSCSGTADGQIELFVSGGTSPFSYNWNSTSGAENGNGTTIANLIADTYQISITDPNSCVDTITVNLEANISVGAPDSTAISACPVADGSGLFDLTSVESSINSNPEGTVNWYEDAAGSVSIPDPGSYSSTGGMVFANISENGCESSTTPIQLIVLASDDPNCQGGADCDTYGVLNFIQGLDSLCQGQPLELLTNDLGAPGITYFWVHPNGDTAQTSTPFYTISAVDPAHEGEFFVYAVAPGCFFDETGPFILTVEGLRDGETIDAGEDQVVCDNQVTLSAVAISSATTFWSSPTGNNISSPNASEISINDLQAGENVFIWNVTTSGCGMIGSDTVRIIMEVPPMAEDDFYTLQRANTEIFMDVLKNDNLTPDLPVEFYPISEPEFGELETLDNGFRYFEKEGQRGVVFFDYVVCNLASNCPNACDTARVTIDVLNLPHLPEGISPNDDGVNDNLVVLGFFENDPGVTMKITITNRWGEIVYESADYTRSPPWDGRFKNSGKPLPQGTYYCAIETKVGAEIYQEIQTIYLVR